MKRASKGKLWNSVGSHVKRAKAEIRMGDQLSARPSGISLKVARANRSIKQEVTKRATLLASAQLD
eukprot:12743144-Prorocentrum_lima.AAC.1